MVTAQELVQETFLTAWRRSESIHLVDGSALPWLLTTCRNHARRERKWRDLLELHDESIAADGEAVDDLRWALDAVADLPDGERSVCEMCLVQGMSYREAAEALGLSEAAVGKGLQRARTRLRRGAEQ